MSDTLKKIEAYKRQEIKARKARHSYDEISAIAREASPVRPFLSALHAKSEAGRVALIAEIKKARLKVSSGKISYLKSWPRPTKKGVLTACQC